MQHASGSATLDKVMNIPFSSSPAGPASVSPFSAPPDIPPVNSWSSIIGIVTAIIGNILISFALNTQRYAHIRIAREAYGESFGKGERLDTPKQSADAFDTFRTGIAEDRPRDNTQVTPGDRHLSEQTRAYGNDDAEETDPLIPKAKNNNVSTSSSTPSGSDVADDTSEENIKRKNYLKSPYWWVGIILMVIGEAGNFLAYGFAPASIVSPLGVVALISNCLIAPFMLKEKFRTRDFLGVTIAVLGAVGVVWSAKGSNPKLGPNQIWDLIERWEFLTYLAITVVVIAILMVASNRVGHRTIAVDIGLVGLYGGYTALSTKGVASLLSYRLFDIFTFGISYLLAAVLIGTAIMQIKYVNRALQRFSSTQVIPAQFVAFTIFVVLGSAILYREFEATTADHILQFFGGVILTFLGVWCITSGRTPDAYGDIEDEEHEIDLVDEEATDDADKPEPESAVQRPENQPGSTEVPSTPLNPRRLNLGLGELSTIDSPDSFATAASKFNPTPQPGPISKPPFQTALSSPLLPSESNRRPPPPSSVPVPPATPSRNTPAFPQATASRSTSQLPGSVAQPAARGVSTTAIPGAATSSIPQGVSSTTTPRQIFTRNSFATGITPNPYTSPLSSGLSAVVADNLRREGRSQSRVLPRRRSTRGANDRPTGLRNSIDASALSGDDGGASSVPRPTIRHGSVGNGDTSTSASVAASSRQHSFAEEGSSGETR